MVFYAIVAFRLYGSANSPENCTALCVRTCLSLHQHMHVRESMLVPDFTFESWHLHSHESV